MFEIMEGFAFPKGRRRRKTSGQDLTFFLLTLIIIGHQPTDSLKQSSNRDIFHCSLRSYLPDSGLESLRFDLPSNILLCGDVKSHPGPSTTTSTTAPTAASTTARSRRTQSTSTTPATTAATSQRSQSTSITPKSRSQRKISYPCVVCFKGVTKASKAVSCDSCDRWTHIRCTPLVSPTIQ